VAAAIVGRRKNSEKLTTSKSFESVHYTLMRSQNELAAICVEEVFDSIGTEFNDVASAVGVSYKVWLDAKVLITVGRI